MADTSFIFEYVIAGWNILWNDEPTFRPLRSRNPNLSVISDTDKAFGRSCLLANINIVASFSSSSLAC